MLALERLAALGARWSPPFLVHCDVLIKIGFLSKGLVALGLRAQEGSLSRVDTKVIKEVMPLSEKHAAATVVTFQKLNMSLSSRVFILEDPELAC